MAASLASSIRPLLMGTESGAVSNVIRGDRLDEPWNVCQGNRQSIPLSLSTVGDAQRVRSVGTIRTIEYSAKVVSVKNGSRRSPFDGSLMTIGMSLSEIPELL